MRRLKVLLVHVGRQTLVKYWAPPVGLLYLAAYARSKMDLDIRIMDQAEEDCPEDKIVRDAVAFEADVVGLSAATPHGFLLGTLTSQLKQALPNALLVVGGPHASAFGAKLLECTAADVVVSGEGEISFEQVLQAHREGAEFGGIPGLAWRSPEGETIVNPGAMPYIEDLDSLPMPAYDLIDVRKYWGLRTVTGDPPPRRYISLFSSRGCPYRCFYCHKAFGRRVRTHSPERIVEEVAYFARQSGANDVEFIDDIFNYDRDRVLAICDLINKRNLRYKLAFPNGLRGDILTEDVVEALVGAGAYSCSFAIETGSPRVQEVIGKRMNIEKALEGIEMTTRRGMYAAGFFMTGFPTETLEDFQRTVDVACRSKLHRAWFFLVMPYPGTELYDLALKTHPAKMAAIDYSNTDYQFRPAVNFSEIPDDVLVKAIRRGTLRFLLDPVRLVRVLRVFPGPLAVARYLPFFARNLGSYMLSQTRWTQPRNK